QGAVTINGVIDASGEDGARFTNNSTDRVPAVGGAGGYSGGVGGNASIPPTAGNGPGGSLGTTTNLPATGIPFGGTFTGSQYLIPLIGGSGGGGSVPACQTFGGGGGGGGGAFLLASSVSITLTNNATITAAGGNGGSPCGGETPGGSGGAIRLIAPTINAVSGGILNVSGGGYGGGAGRIRLEAFSIGGNFNPNGPLSTSTPFNLVVPATPPSSIKVVSLVTSTGTIPINAN